MNLSETRDFSNWMRDLDPSLHTVPCCQLAIPGSHDSFSYSISATAAVGPDNVFVVKELVKLFGTAAKDILYRWSLTQSLNVLQQLQRGIRYLDCRLCWCSDTNDFRFVHGLMGAKALPCLQDVNEFLECHPKELVLLDFNHFFNMSKTDHENFLTSLIDIFGSKICLHFDIELVTLQMAWDHGFQVLIFYQNDIVKGNVTNIFWPSSSIRSPWANTEDLPNLIEYLDKNYKDGRPDNLFYNWQGVLTPGVASIILHFKSSLKDSFAIKVAPILVSWLKSKRTGRQGISICTMDYVELSDFVPTVIDLNRQNLQ